jgi:hypothetical protein
MLQNIDFCLERGVFDAVDLGRLLAGLQMSERLPLLADQFGERLGRMAERCLDAGIVYVRTSLLVPEQESQWFSPPPVPDEGWDAMADRPPEWDFYSRQFCPAMCDALGVSPVVLHHVKLTPDQAAQRHGMNAVGLVVDAMTRLHLPFRADEWRPTNDVGYGGTTEVLQRYKPQVEDKLECLSVKAPLKCFSAKVPAFA